MRDVKTCKSLQKNSDTEASSSRWQRNSRVEDGTSIVWLLICTCKLDPERETCSDHQGPARSARAIENGADVLIQRSSAQRLSALNSRKASARCAVG